MPLSPSPNISLKRQSYVESLRKNFKKRSKAIGALMARFDLLEHFSFPISDEAMARKLHIFAWPRALEMELGDVDRVLKIARLRLIRDLRTNMEVFWCCCLCCVCLCVCAVLC